MAGALHGACDLKTLTLDSLTAQQFGALRKTEPFLLTDAASVWAGWPEGAAFSAAFSGMELPLRNATALAQHGSAGTTSSRADVGAYAAGKVGACGGMLFSNHAEDASDTARAFMSLPPVLDGVGYDDIFSVGWDGSGVPFHRHDENWLGLVAGRKRWLLAPPHVRETPLTDPCALSAPVLSRLGSSSSAKNYAPLAKELVECEQKAGTILFIPSRWWHATCNLASDDGSRGGAAAPPALLSVAFGQQSLAGYATELPRLHAAALRGTDYEWLEHNAAAAVRAEHNGFEPLHLAAKGGRLQAARLLLTAGADVNARGQMEFTPLHWAVQRRQRAVAELLLARGANLRAQDSMGVTPTAYAAHVGDVPMLEYVLGRGGSCSGKLSCGKLARMKGHAHMVEWLQVRVEDGALRKLTPERLRAFYTKHNPEKLAARPNFVRNVLKKNSDERLLAKLTKAYGESPLDLALPEKAEDADAAGGREEL